MKFYFIYVGILGGLGWLLSASGAALGLLNLDLNLGLLYVDYMFSQSGIKVRL